MFGGSHKFFLFLFFVGNLFVHQTFAQKNKLGISFQWQPRYLWKNKDAGYDTDNLDYKISGSYHYGVVYERDWDEIFLDLNLNFNTIKFDYQWIYGSGFGDGGPDGGFMVYTTDTEEILRSRFNLLGLDLIMGAKGFQLDNKILKFYFFYGIGLDYPIYMKANYSTKTVKKYELRTNYQYESSYFDTTYYSYSTSRFKETILVNIPIGVRYRFSIVKKFYFDINFAFRPQLNNFSGDKSYSFKNGISVGGLLTLPIGRKSTNVAE